MISSPEYVVFFRETIPPPKREKQKRNKLKTSAGKGFKQIMGTERAVRNLFLRTSCFYNFLIFSYAHLLKKLRNESTKSWMWYLSLVVS